MTTSLPRLSTLFQTQCRIFDTIYNPTRARLGNKILRQRLKGPALAAYYPRRLATIQTLERAYPGYEFANEEEDDRLENVQVAKSRGKGAPKKRKGNEPVTRGKKGAAQKGVDGRRR